MTPRETSTTALTMSPKRARAMAANSCLGRGSRTMRISEGLIRTKGKSPRQPCSSGGSVAIRSGSADYAEHLDRGAEEETVHLHAGAPSLALASTGLVVFTPIPQL